MCFAIAIVFHVVVLATWSLEKPFGAKADGVGGLEVGIGLAGVPPQEPPPVAEKLDSRPTPLLPAELPPLLPKQTPEKITLTDAKLKISLPHTEIERVEIDTEFDSFKVLHDESLNISRENQDNQISLNVGFGSGTTASFGGDQGARASYVAIVSSLLNKHRIYPSKARSKGIEGKLTLVLELRRSGDVMLAEIRSSSGVDLLDEAALEMVRKARPFPPFPPNLDQNVLRFNLPISFSIDMQ